MTNTSVFFFFFLTSWFGHLVGAEKHLDLAILGCAQINILYNWKILTALFLLSANVFSPLSETINNRGI